MRSTMKRARPGAPRTTLAVALGAICVLVALVALSGVAGWRFGLGAAASSPPAMVTIRTFAFQPTSITVPAGSEVVWINQDDSPHTVTSTDHALNSAGLDQGDRFSATFDKPGTYPYFCSLHPQMRGVVVVR